jgi:hypothetical protein
LKQVPARHSTLLYEFRRTMTVRLAMLVCLGLVISGCGGSSTGGGQGTSGTQATGRASSAGSSQSESNNAKRLAFSQCMRSQGISNFPDPSGQNSVSGSLPPGIDVNSPQYQSAQGTCAHLLPSGGADPGGSAQGQEQTLQYVACMRSHGYPNFPDPNSSGDLVIPQGVDPNSPQFDSAQRACQSLLPEIP